MNLLDHIKSLLQQNESFCQDGRLFKNSVVEAALKLDPTLLKLLLSDDKAKKYFFADVDGITVFDKVKFQKFVSNKEFLPDSFTAYKNKIGLTANGEYLTEANEVVLDFPYKDCVLEGGQTKEDQKRKEIFWNETLAPDEIDRLLEPKTLTNWKKYDKDGEHTVDSVSKDDNLIIKGNNLLALHSLLPKYKGQVKLIYIDPPYNTGKDDFGYNDRFNHSAWMTFMKSRLEAAKHLLSKSGNIWVNIDDNEAHYIKVLMDSIFGRESFVGNVIWEKKYAPSNDTKGLAALHDHILVYQKSADFSRNLLPRSEKANKPYKHNDNDGKGPWRSGDLLVRTYSKSSVFEIKNPNTGESYLPKEGSSWRANESTLKKWILENRIYFGKDGKGAPQLKRYLSEVQDGMVPGSVWSHSEVGHNDQAKKEIEALFGEKAFMTPKPERLLQRIIHIGSNEGDLVLDFFAGSGTTAAVAHKMGRRFIITEQMDYVNTVTVERLKKVIGVNATTAKKEISMAELSMASEEGVDYSKFAYDKGGISEKVNWKGGGSFVYAELAQDNAGYIDSIQAAKKSKALIKIWNEIKGKGFISYKVSPKDIDDSIAEFSDLSLDDQKKLLIFLLDKNQLYVNYSDMEDADHKISKEDQALNHQFYQS